MTFEDFDSVTLDYDSNEFIMSMGDFVYVYDIDEEYDLLTQIVGSGNVEVFEVVDGQIQEDVWF